MQPYLDLLRRRDYALLWAGATVSELGDGMSFVALVWLILERGGDAGTVGWLSAAYTAPVVIGGLAAGIILDRFDRRRVLAGDNLVRGAAIASVPIASALGVLSTAQLFVVAAVYGLLYMTSVAGIPSLIPDLVSEDELTTANAMESISYGLGGLVGPALAGIVIAIFSAPVVLAIDAASYAVFVVCLLAMGPSSFAVEHRPAAERRPAGAATVAPATESSAADAPAAVPPRPRAGGGLGPAIRFILGAPAIVAITVIYMGLNLSTGVFTVLAPVYSRDVLGGDATTYGAILSAFEAGGLVGLIVVGAIRWRWPLGRSIAVATFSAGLALGLLLVRPSFLPTLLILAAAGLFASSLTAWAQTIRMRLIPPELRGRVFALLRTTMQSTRPIGAVVGGVLLAGGDPIPAIAATAGFVVIPGAIGLWLPALGRGPTAEPDRGPA
jgi:MFS family permease